MAAAYVLREADTQGYDIDAAHEIGLPGVICPNCGTWAKTGAAYPTVLRETLSPVLTRMTPHPRPLNDYLELRQRVSELIGTGRPLFPGTKFDSVVGSVVGITPEFAWSNPWTLFVQRRAFDRLRDEGFALYGRSAQLKSRRQHAPELIEIEAVPGVHLHASILAEQGLTACRLCGRLGVRKPEVIVLERASLNEAIPLQRVFELTTIVVNLELAERIARQGWRGVELTAINAE